VKDGERQWQMPHANQNTSEAGCKGIQIAVHCLNSRLSVLTLYYLTTLKSNSYLVSVKRNNSIRYNKLVRISMGADVPCFKILALF
jgi:hypothetical protein